MIELNLSKYKLPKIYKRKGKECYLDEIRQKLIYVTPEETVRQRTISYLINDLDVPSDMLLVEEKLAHYGLKSNKRADIIIHKVNENNELDPIAVIECKAPGILLGEKAIQQALDYSDALMCDYVMIVNGDIAFCYKYNEALNQYYEIEALPKFTDMLEGKCLCVQENGVPERITFENLKENIDVYKGHDIGNSTEECKVIPAMNLWECLLDTEYRMPVGKYELFSLIEDYGVRMLSYGNSSGGYFAGPYRSFLVDVDGNTEFVSIGISTYITHAKPDVEKTSLNVAVDNEKESHHALQLVIDDNMEIIKDKCAFYHHGRIGISNLGSGKISELKKFVYKKCPKLIYDNRFYLGTLKHNRLWRLDDEEVITLIENLISYALIRDEYRSYVKENNKK